MVKYRVTINKDLCTNCGIAAGRCPTHSRVLARIFDKKREKISEDVSGIVFPEDLYNVVKRAAEACPVNAIIIKKIKE